MMNPITDIETLQNLTERYSIKGTVTNNYLLPASYEEFILNKKIYYIQSDNNLMLLVDRNISYQVYYFINNLKENFELPDISKPLMMEIIYRGKEKRPHDILGFWEKQGFVQHLTRDNLLLNYSNKQKPELTKHNIRIVKAETEAQAEYTTKLFESDLDKYTGDLKTKEEIVEYVKQGKILCAYSGEELCGALQFEIKNNVVWLGHIVVDAGHRGKGIANSLVKEYIELNAKGLDTKYQLWVIDDNAPAVNLYKRFGFEYAKKSTASMLKLK